MAVYKDHLFAARCRLERLRASGSAPILPQDVTKVYAHRLARAWAGGVGIAGFGLLVAQVLGGTGRASVVLVATWIAMVVTFALGLLLGRLLFPRRVRRALARAGDVFRELALLEAGGAAFVAVRRAHALESASLTLPLCAAALLAPLSLHLVAARLLFGTGLEDFDAWIGICLLLVGHAHLALVVLCVVHVGRLRAELDAGVPLDCTSRGLRALGWVTLASCLPGLLLVFLPPLLVFSTGIIFVPWIFAWAGRCAWRERLRLEDHGLVP